MRSAIVCYHFVSFFFFLYVHLLYFFLSLINCRNSIITILLFHSLNTNSAIFKRYQNCAWIYFLNNLIIYTTITSNNEHSWNAHTDCYKILQVRKGYQDIQSHQILSAIVTSGQRYWGSKRLKKEISSLLEIC